MGNLNLSGKKAVIIILAVVLAAVSCACNNSGKMTASQSSLISESALSTVSGGATSDTQTAAQSDKTSSQSFSGTDPLSSKTAGQNSDASTSNVEKGNKLTNQYGIYFGDLPQFTKPKKLLVILFNYNNGYYCEKSEDAIAEKAWGDYIFGSGTISGGTASVNDYFKEISNGKFYYEPVLLGDNTTGVYSVHLDKDYTDEQALHPEYPFFEFSYDLAGVVDDLKANGLNTTDFKLANVNKSNYVSTLINYFDADQAFRQKEWYATDTILAIFPPYNTEKVDMDVISRSINDFGLVAHINHTSSFGTIVHELLHTLGTIDIYNFGRYGSDIMSDTYNYISGDFNSIHVDPYYKLLFGWENINLLQNGTDTVTLYPATSAKYNPIVVKTDDAGQYYIIENRAAEKFDHGVSAGNNLLGIDATGINIWQIDKLGMEAIYNSSRKGMMLYPLHSPNESVDLKYYQSSESIKNVTAVSSGITVTYLKNNADGSIDVKITRK